jgi:hypothetical protein
MAPVKRFQLKKNNYNCVLIVVATIYLEKSYPRTHSKAKQKKYFLIA